MKKGNIIKQKSHNPCFSGNSFAIREVQRERQAKRRHNPCFSGNSFAIKKTNLKTISIDESQSLF